MTRTRSFFRWQKTNYTRILRPVVITLRRFRRWRRLDPTSTSCGQTRLSSFASSERGSSVTWKPFRLGEDDYKRYVGGCSNRSLLHAWGVVMGKRCWKRDAHVVKCFGREDDGLKKTKRWSALIWAWRFFRILGGSALALLNQLLLSVICQVFRISATKS